MFTTEQLFSDICQENFDYVLMLSFTKHPKIWHPQCQNVKVRNITILEVNKVFKEKKKRYFNLP